MKTFKNLSKENQKSFNVKGIVSYNIEALRFTINKFLQSINDVPTLEAMSNVLEDTYNKLTNISTNYFKSTTHETDNKKNLD